MAESAHISTPETDAGKGLVGKDSLASPLKWEGAAALGEAELAAVYDQSVAALCLFDEQFQIVRANRAAADFAGWNRDGGLTLPVSAGRFFHCPSAMCDTSRDGPGTACRECELCRAVDDTFRAGKAWHRVRLKKLMERKDHLDEAVIRVSTRLIQAGGVSRVLLCLEDVTRSERVDDQIRAQAELLDFTHDAILVRDFSDHILYWNEGAHRMYGWTAAEVLHRTMSEVLLGTDVQPAVEALRTVRDKGSWMGEMKHRTRPGAEITVQSRWTMVRERDGVPRGILVVSTDITDRKRLEEHLLRAQRLESVGTLASGLAHDLNNVLAPIMMATHILQEEATDEKTRTWVQTLDTCSRRGADIVRQVLMFARGVKGSRVALQPAQLLGEMERIVKETFPKSIELVVHNSRKPWQVQGDATQLQQVLMNLCVNARDAMPEGGTLSLRIENVELSEETLSLHPKAKPGPYVVLSVGDTGTGIPPELMDKIFDPFFTTKPLGHGTGLGLPTVLGICESHGGFVLVDSTRGRGTMFKVYLPALREVKPGAAAKTEKVPVPRGRGERILVVDDEPAIRRITYVILANHGYEAFLAANGHEAVELFRQHQDAIKLVITDLLMPKMDGPATIRALRQIKPDLKAITVTGLGDEHRLGDASAAGSDDFLNKPFTSEQLLLKMALLLRNNGPSAKTSPESVSS